LDVHAGQGVTMERRDEPPESHLPLARTKRRWVALVTAALGGLVAVAVVTTGGAGLEKCAVLRQGLAQLERDVPMDAAQAWDDIYLLQDALKTRNGLRAELRAHGCD
jgi:hypothetical protein